MNTFKKKPTIVFFSRDYQAELFPMLKSDCYDSLHVTMLKSEKKKVESTGAIVVGCFEEALESEASLNDTKFANYLKTSFCSDRFYGKFNIKERILLLAIEKKFWSDIFDKYKPLAVVNETVAIEISEVMAIEAESRNIKYLAWQPTLFKDKCFFFSSTPYDSSLDQRITNISTDTDSINKATELFNCEDKTPFYTKNLPHRLNVVSFCLNIRSYFIYKIKKVFYCYKNKYIKDYITDDSFIKFKLNLYFASLFYRYESFSTVKDKFELVFYPLHYEPEATLFYSSEFNDIQPALIRNLCKCLKQNQVLVVKEHPQQPGMLLSKTYRKLKKDLSNLFYLPAEYPTNRIIFESKLVVTLVGTAGWQALMQGKPVAVLGKVFYDSYQFINKVDNFDKLRQLIRSEKYVYPQKEATIDFIAKMYKFSKKGNPYPHADLYSKANIQQIISVISEEIQCSQSNTNQI